MEFFPDCGKMLIPKNNKVKCSCGYTKSLNKNDIEEQYTAKGEEKHQEKVVVIDDSVVTMPTTKGLCYKCGNTKIAWWMLQTRSADEAPTIFYRCTKCGNTWKGHD